LEKIENQRLMKDFPDPYDYIIGFHITNSNDYKKTTVGSSPLAMSTYL